AGDDEVGLAGSGDDGVAVGLERQSPEPVVAGAGVDGGDPTVAEGAVEVAGGVVAGHGQVAVGLGSDDPAGDDGAVGGQGHGRQAFLGGAEVGDREAGPAAGAEGRVG